MRARLVVGEGQLAHDVLETLQADPEPLFVLTDNRRYEERLQAAGFSVTVERGDPTDPEAFAAFDAVESVLALDDNPAHNAAVLAASQAGLPEAFTLGYLGSERDTMARDAIRTRADRVVDPGSALLETVTQRTSEAGRRMHDLKKILADIEGTLAIVMHDNPDPDAIASAIALAAIAQSVGCDSEPCYYGSISHQENRAFVNLLELDLRNLPDGADVSEYGGVALVDHSMPGVNDQLPADTPIDIVVDHHPPRGPVDARYVDLRHDVGATSTLMVKYFQQFGIDLTETIATALLFGIRVDTDEFSREVCVDDFEAASELVKHADLGTLQRIENPSMDPDTLETIADAISNRVRHGTVLISNVGELTNRDALAQSADRLLNMEGVTTTLVYGTREKTVYVSARARGADIDLGEALRDAYGQIGSAGGHADMAGAQITPGILEEDVDSEFKRAEQVDEVITNRFLEVLQARWNRPVRRYSEDLFVAGESANGSVALFDRDGSRK